MFECVARSPPKALANGAGKDTARRRWVTGMGGDHHGTMVPDIKVYAVRDRRTSARSKLPWIARHSIDGRQRSKAFRTRAEADRYRSLLLQAAAGGERFDDASGEPLSWQEPPRDVLVHEWARRWPAEQWQEWQSRTRSSAAEALARFVTLAVQPAPTAALNVMSRQLAFARRAPADADRWH
jgi:hypothetical protein